MSSVMASSTSLVEAINFLTCPLSLIIPQSTINLLQQILLSSLTAVPAWLRNSRLILSFSSVVPPRAIFAGCIAANLEWSNWFYALGGREFDLIIERTQVSVQMTGTPERTVIWKEAPARHTTPTSSITLSVPRPRRDSIGKLNQSIRQGPALPTLAINPLVTSRRPKTLAQQILQSEHEEEEADEIFAMISNFDACLISPAPTRKSFNTSKAPLDGTLRLSALEEDIFHSRSPFRQSAFVQDHNTLSPVSSPESSRASSPLSSLYSSEGGLTFTSRTPSPPTSPNKYPVKFPIPPPPYRSPAPRRESASQAAYNKNQVQRYLYQGGQSTVLTGGVMLGSPSKPSTPTHATPLAPIPKYRTPTGQRNMGSMAKFQSQINSRPWRGVVVPSRV